jgi:hypothetical protein
VFLTSICKAVSVQHLLQILITQIRSWGTLLAHGVLTVTSICKAVSITFVADIDHIDLMLKTISIPVYAIFILTLIGAGLAMARASTHLPGVGWV